MKNTKQNGKLGRIWGTVREIAAVALPVAAVASSLLNLLITSELAPLAKEQVAIVERVKAIETNETDLVRKEELNQIVTRINIISGRVDLLVLKLIPNYKF